MASIHAVFVEIEKMISNKRVVTQVLTRKIYCYVFRNVAPRSIGTRFTQSSHRLLRLHWQIWCIHDRLRVRILGSSSIISPGRSGARQHCALPPTLRHRTSHRSPFMSVVVHSRCTAFSPPVQCHYPFSSALTGLRSGQRAYTWARREI